MEDVGSDGKSALLLVDTRGASDLGVPVPHGSNVAKFGISIDLLADVNPGVEGIGKLPVPSSCAVLLGFGRASKEVVLVKLKARRKTLGF